jgi:hypothetical protein
MNKANDGVIYTRRWVVEMILDGCGYVSTKDLTLSSIIEPSCGDGAFLVPIVERLCESLKTNKRNLLEAKQSIFAFDTDAEKISVCREKLATLLHQHEASDNEIEQVLDYWLIAGDYLLEGGGIHADFVIGNPPYIRATSLSAYIRNQYQQALSTMSMGTDIYVGFFERGLRSLNENGVLCFICADRWMHNAYGKKLRKMIIDGYAVETVLRMHDVDAFESEVSAYPAIVQIRKTEQGSVSYANLSEAFDAQSVAGLQLWLSDSQGGTLDNETTSAHMLTHWFNFDSAWPLTSPERIALLETLNENFEPLENANSGTSIGIGVATGCDDIFLVDDKSLIEEELLVPIVTSTQIRSGAIKREPLWLINPWTSDGSLINLNEYPKARQYFRGSEDRLRNRHVAKKGNDNSWYRTIDKVYGGLRDKPKLLIQDMKSHLQPVYDDGSYYPHHNLYWITSDTWDLEVLGGLLLSNIADLFVDAYGVKMRGGTMRLQAQYLRKIRVPDPSAIDARTSNRLRAAFRNNDQKEATDAALEAYGLESEKMWAI